MPKQLAHEEHLNQGSGDGGGGSRTRTTGSQTKQGPTGTGTKGPSGDHLSSNFVKPRANGSPYVGGPNVPGSDKTNERSGGGLKGHDRIDPTLGKHDGTNLRQHPNVTVKKIGASGTYLGK